MRSGRGRRRVESVSRYCAGWVFWRKKNDRYFQKTKSLVCAQCALFLAYIPSEERANNNEFQHKPFGHLTLFFFIRSLCYSQTFSAIQTSSSLLVNSSANKSHFYVRKRCLHSCILTDFMKDLCIFPEENNSTNSSTILCCFVESFYENLSTNVVTSQYHRASVHSQVQTNYFPFITFLPSPPIIEYTL